MARLTRNDCDRFRALLEGVTDEFDTLLVPCNNVTYHYDLKRRISMRLALLLDYDDMNDVVNDNLDIIDLDAFYISLMARMYLNRTIMHTVSSRTMNNNERLIFSNSNLDMNYAVMSKIKNYIIPEIIFLTPHTKTAEIIEATYKLGHKVLTLYKVFTALHRYYPGEYYYEYVRYYSLIQNNRTEYLDIFKQYNNLDVIEELRDIFPFEPTASNLHYFFFNANRGNTFKDACKFDNRLLTFKDFSNYLEIDRMDNFSEYYEQGMTPRQLLRNIKLIPYFTDEAKQDMRDRR